MRENSNHSKKNMTNTVIALITIILSVVSVSRSYSAAETHVSERLAVIRIKDVIEKYRRFNILDKRLKRQFKRKLINMEHEKKRLEEELEQYRDAEDKESLERVLDIQRKMFDLRARYNHFYKVVNALELKMAREIFKDIRNSIETASKEKSIAHVLSVLTLSQVAEEASSLEELIVTYRTTPVLYFDSELDLTEIVLTELNNNYDKKKDVYYTEKNLETLVTEKDILDMEEARKKREDPTAIFEEEMEADDESSEQEETPDKPEAEEKKTSE